MDTAWNDSVRESKMQNLLWNLGNAMGNMSAAGLADKAYIYAYDETPESNTSVHTIREMLGAVKQKYPTLRTMATLNWPSIVSGFPGVAGGIPSDFPGCLGERVRPVGAGRPLPDRHAEEDRAAGMAQREPGSQVLVVLVVKMTENFLDLTAMTVSLT